MRLEVDNLSAPGDHGHSTREYAIIGLGFHGRRDAREPLTGHPLHVALLVGLAIRCLCVVSGPHLVDDSAARKHRREPVGLK